MPVIAYIASHWYAFTHQFLVLVQSHRLHQEGPLLWLSQETVKYFQYYRITPAILLLALFSLIVAFRVFPKVKGEQSPSRETLLLFAVLYVSIALPIALGFVSGHKPWHHLIVAPFWSLLCGVVVDRAVKSSSTALRKAAFIAVSLALANGFVCNWAGRSYSVLSSWGSRDIDRLTGQIDAIVPEKASVWGDYRLLFHARKRGWDFATPWSTARAATPSTFHAGRFSDTDFEFVILSDMASAPEWLDLSRYEHVASMNIPPSPFTLPGFNPLNRPIALSVYRREGFSPDFSGVWPEGR
jgi:hypothetical protein